MQTLELLGMALGLATLSGVNLYLTVFVAGLAIRMGWIEHLATQYQQLEILADPVIITISGVLFFLEFFADKVPWVDSLWDSVHTVIRPIGGAMLAITVLGDVNPVYDVVVALLAGGMSLTTHAAKAGTRLLVNVSPEPASNIGVSVAEDAVVLAGLGIVATHPVVALIVCLVVVGLLVWLLPGLIRSTKATLWFLFRRITHMTRGGQAPEAGSTPPVLLDALRRTSGREVAVEMALPCVSGGGVGRKNAFGWILLTTGPARGLTFASRGAGAPSLVPVEWESQKATHVAGWICDRIELRNGAGRRTGVLQFDRSRREHVARLADLLSARPVAEAVPVLA